MKLISAIILICLLVACNQSAEKKDAEVNPAVSMSQKVENQSAMDSNLNVVITRYLDIKDGLIEADTAAADIAAEKLIASIDSIFPDTDTLQVTPVSTLFSNIAAESKGLVGETDITEKRKEFSVISDNLSDLLKLVKYKGSKLYRQTCPMAFNDTEAANWLSNSSEVVNPYLGKKHEKYKGGMLHCGEVTDSIMFR